MKILALTLTLFLTSVASAQCPNCGRYHSGAPRITIQQPSYANSSYGTVTYNNTENAALTEVNKARRRRGLRPFLHDPALTLAAQRCASVRAKNHIHGHTPNDFSYLPPGTTARAAGCGANSPTWGWTTCCTYDNYTYAGAAWVWGNDGRRYMHLFVR